MGHLVKIELLVYSSQSKAVWLPPDLTTLDPGVAGKIG